MNLNPELTVQDYMYYIQYGQLDTLYEPVLFESPTQIRVSHAAFKLTRYLFLFWAVFEIIELFRKLYWMIIRTPD